LRSRRRSRPRRPGSARTTSSIANRSSASCISTRSIRWTLRRSIPETRRPTRTDTLTGFDHLLFVLGLILRLRGWRRLVGTITAFTVGHSVTLALATLGVIHVPTRAVEVLIAITIFAVAVELARDRSQWPSWIRRAPWVAAFAFGLLHGLGFAGALAEVGLPPHEIPIALFSFNVGIELGQLAFVAIVLGARRLLVAMPVRWPVAAAQIPAYVIGSLAAYWAVERAWVMLPA